MTKRTRRDADTMSFTLSRWYRRISEMKPSSITFVVVVVAVSTLLLSGLIYQFTAGTPLTFYDGNRFYFVYTADLDPGGSGLSGQLGMDVVISAMLYVFGFIGLLLMYHSTRNAYKPRNAYMTLIVGVTLVAFAYLFIEAIIRIKTG